jgi:hypothetical protein
MSTVLTTLSRVPAGSQLPERWIDIGPEFALFEDVISTRDYARFINGEALSPFAKILVTPFSSVRVQRIDCLEPAVEVRDIDKSGYHGVYLAMVREVRNMMAKASEDVKMEYPPLGINNVTLSINTVDGVPVGFNIFFTTSGHGTRVFIFVDTEDRVRLVMCEDRGLEMIQVVSDKFIKENCKKLESERICAFCCRFIAEGHKGRCGRCGVPRYCCKECQEKDWPLHRAQCRAGAQR